MLVVPTLYARFAERPQHETTESEAAPGELAAT